jgi:serine/threonine-protein kinase
MPKQPALIGAKPQFTTDEWVERFKREVRLAGQLHHPNFVRIYDFGLMSGGHFYYAMEHIDGVNFAELVEREGIQPPVQVAQLLKLVCEALEEAHGLGILHRDIKPQNLMVRRVSGEELMVKILDFGLVKAINNDHSRDLTVGLRILGTPAYLAPERILAPNGADPRSDLYSIGAVGFFLLTGRKVFESESGLQLTHRILNEPAPRVSDFSPGNVTPELDDLIFRCLAKEPAERPPSAQALANELAEVLDKTGTCHRLDNRYAGRKQNRQDENASYPRQ